MEVEVRDYDVVTWLGDVVAELEEEDLEVLVDRIRTAWEAVRRQFPSSTDPWGRVEDDPDGDTAAEAAGLYLLGMLTIEQARSEYEAAQRQVEEARLRLRGAVTAAVEVDGMSASKAAAQAGVAVSTVTRQWGLR